MRTDHIETLNANLEAHALYLEQVVAFHHSEIAKLTKVIGITRALAQKEALPEDPEINAKPMEFPAVAKPRPAGEDYRRSGQASAVGATRSQNDASVNGQNNVERKLEQAVAGAV